MKEAAVFLQDSVSGQETLLAVVNTSAVLGKSSSADIQLNDYRCNGIHALLEIDSEQEKASVIDLGSRGGVYVDQQPRREARLNSGDSFSIGSSKVVIRFLPQAASWLMPSHPGPLPDSGEPEYQDSIQSNRNSLLTEKSLLQVSLYLGQQFLEVATFSAGSKITIGSHQGATFGVTLPGQSVREAYVLAEYLKGHLFLYLTDAMKGFIWQENEVIPLSELEQRELAIRIGDRADIQIGELTLSFQFVNPPSRPKQRWFPWVHPQVARLVGTVVGLYFILFFWMSLTSVEPEKEKMEDVSKEVKKVMYKVGVQSAKKQRKSAIGKIAKTEGGRARGQEGKAKSRKSPQKKSEKTQQKKKTQEKSQQKVQKSKEEVDLNQVFASETNEKNTQTAQVAKKQQTGNTASAVASQDFARGKEGLGSGGGGQSVGVGQLKGYGSGGGKGGGDQGLKPSKGRQIEVPDKKEVVVKKGLDPEVIRARIRRYLPQIQHCYETHLDRNQSLNGKVNVGFTIVASGGVNQQKVIDTTLNHQPTENCILKKVGQWQFPEPKGGGTVAVKYPFVLMSNSREPAKEN